MFVASSASFCTFRSSRVSSLQGGRWGEESAGFGHWNAAWGSSPKASKGHVSFFSDSSQKLLGIKTLPPTARVLARWSSYKQMPDAIETVKWNQSISSHLKRMIWLVTRNGHDDVHERFKWHHLVLTILHPQSILKILSLSSKIHLSNPFSLSMSDPWIALNLGSPLWVSKGTISKNCSNPCWRTFDSNRSNSFAWCWRPVTNNRRNIATVSFSKLHTGMTHSMIQHDYHKRQTPC